MSIQTLSLVERIRLFDESMTIIFLIISSCLIEFYFVLANISAFIIIAAKPCRRGVVFHSLLTAGYTMQIEKIKC